jgi:hypothetical protein
MRSKPMVLALAFSVSVVAIAWSADEPASTATATSTASDAAKAPAKEETQEEIDAKHVLARGYKKETHGNQTVYCRKEIKTGSHFETKICGTAESLILQERQARDLMQSQSAAGSKNN